MNTPDAITGTLTTDRDNRYIEVINDPQGEVPVMNLLIVELDYDIPTDYDVVFAGIQGFVGSEGGVSDHSEDPDVYEIYFPLSGEVDVRRDHEYETLEGPFKDLTDLDNDARFEISPDYEHATLEVRMKSTGETVVVDGFIIKPGQIHSTAIIKPRTPSRFLALKIKQRI